MNKKEEWIKSNKQRFKDEYGSNWEQVLYATANKMFKEEMVTTGDVANAETPLFKKTKFMGHDCIEMDDESYQRCKMGKVKYERWASLIKDEELRKEVSKMYNRNGTLMISNGYASSFMK